MDKINKNTYMYIYLDNVCVLLAYMTMTLSFLTAYVFSSSKIMDAKEDYFLICGQCCSLQNLALWLPIKLQVSSKPELSKATSSVAQQADPCNVFTSYSFAGLSKFCLELALKTCLCLLIYILTWFKGVIGVYGICSTFLSTGSELSIRLSEIFWLNQLVL